MKLVQTRCCQYDNIESKLAPKDFGSGVYMENSFFNWDFQAVTTNPTGTITKNSVKCSDISIQQFRVKNLTKTGSKISEALST